MTHIFLNYFRYFVNMRNKTFHILVDQPNDWFHSILSFLGPNEISMIYHDGKAVFGENYLFDRAHEANDKGNIVLNKVSVDTNTLWADPNGGSSIEVDEMLFFNRKLIQTEIRMFSQNTV